MKKHHEKHHEKLNTMRNIMRNASSSIKFVVEMGSISVVYGEEIYLHSVEEDEFVKNINVGLLERIETEAQKSLNNKFPNLIRQDENLLLPGIDGLNIYGSLRDIDTSLGFMLLTPKNPEGKLNLFSQFASSICSNEEMKLKIDTAASIYENQITTIKEENAELRGKNKVLSKEKSQNDDELQEIKAMVNKLSRDIGNMSKHNTKLSLDIENMSKQNTKLFKNNVTLHEDNVDLRKDNDDLRKDYDCIKVDMLNLNHKVNVLLRHDRHYYLCLAAEVLNRFYRGDMNNVVKEKARYTNLPQSVSEKLSDILKHHVKYSLNLFVVEADNIINGRNMRAHFSGDSDALKVQVEDGINDLAIIHGGAIDEGEKEMLFVHMVLQSYDAFVAHTRC